MSKKEYPGQDYQELFSHISNEHNLYLTQSEMDEIICIVHAMNKRELPEDKCFTDGDIDNIDAMLLGPDFRNDCLGYMNEKAEAYAAAKTENLQAWKESASEVLNGIKLQEIGKEIGVELGKSIGPEILPWIRRVKAVMEQVRDTAQSEIDRLKSKS